MIFNILFWAAAGSISGFIVWISIKRKVFKEKEIFYWVVFYIIPFAIIYSVLGRLPTPQPAIVTWRQNAVYDHHLSFIWITSILFALALFLRRQDCRYPWPPFMFALEIVTVIVICQFCSNLPYIDTLNRVIHFIVRNFPYLTPERLMKFSYFLGVASIGSFYFLALFKLRPLFLKSKFISDYALIVLFLFIVSGLVSVLFMYSVKKRNIIEDISFSSAGEQQSDNKKIPHVILIVLDTLRADRLTIYNSKINTSKNLELFAKDALVFDQCIAPSPWTLPAHASLFTGLYVSEHRCEYIISYLPILSDQWKTLAEIYKDNGYKTAAIVANFGWLDPRFNIHQGFQLYDCLNTVGIQLKQPFRPILVVFSYYTNLYIKSFLAYRTAGDITSEAIKLSDRIRQEPFFLFLNYNDTHSPYQAPRPFDRYFMDEFFPQLYRLKQYFFRIWKKYDKSIWDAYLRSQYDGSVAYLDSQLGRLFSYFKKTGIYDSSLIIICGDHGELLGEHGLYEHHSKMYEGVVKVPLLIKFPFSSRVGRENKPINLVDVFSTILSICDIPIPDNISGEPYGGTSSSSAELYSYEIGEHKVIYDGKYKYMIYRNSPDKKYIKSELYDLGKDPEETENLVEKYPDVAAALQTKLQNWEKAHKRERHKAPPKNVKPLSEDTKEALRSLGYVQ